MTKLQIATIYVITNLYNQKKYVGITQHSIEKRWRGHLQISSGCTLLKKAIKKYGTENFLLEAVYCSKDVDHALQVMEPYFIRFYGSHCKDGRGYNANYGGQYSKFGIETSSEAILKMSIARKGKPCSDTRRLAIAKALKGRVISHDAREKLRNHNLGKKASEETKIKMRKPHVTTETHRRNLALANKRHLYIVQTPSGEFIETKSLREFALTHGLTQSGLSRTANGHQPHHHGHRVTKIS